MNTLNSSTEVLKKSPTRYPVASPISEKSHLEAITVHNDYWRQWSANRQAAAPVTHRKLTAQRWTILGRRLLGLGLGAAALGAIFNSLASIH